ncbi:MAG: hypothetical protein J6Z79_05225 [Clostridia bacterium]|nr:hypothetical protein [Clostridia bacterium]
MSKRDRTFSVSAGLLRLGDALRFAPEEDRFVPEKEPRSYRLIPPEKLLVLKNALARMREQSLFLSLAGDFARGMLLTRFRSFATLFFTSGLIQTVSYFIGSYFPLLSGTQDNLVVGLVLIILGLVCAFERAAFGVVLKQSALFRHVIHPLFGVSEWEIPEGRNREHLWWMLASGAALGVLSVIASPYRVILWITFAVAVCVTLYKPEAGLAFAALFFPFLPPVAEIGLILLIHLSLIMKIAVGKRSLSRSPADLFVLILIAVILIRGGAAGVIYAVVLSVYFLGINLCRTAVWLRRIVIALALSVGISALAALTVKAFGRFAPEALRYVPGAEVLLSALTGREHTALAVILLPAIFCLAGAGKQTRTRLLGILILPLAALVLAASHDPGLWLGAAVGLVLALSLSRRWGLLFCIFSGLGAYTGWVFLPDGLRLRLTTFLGVNDLALAEWAKRLTDGRALLKEALPWGLGKGTSRLAPEGIGVYDLAGVFGGYIVLAAMAAAVIWFFVRCARFSACGGIGDVHPLVLGAMAGVLVWLVCGLTSPMTSPEALFPVALFLSFPKAAQDACRREEYRQPY